ncbi:histidine kinase [Mariprofundus ferrooxydans]|uniref:histidine kinase n=2 Tax=Mariprofundus ferrooxydans TaxID=314344 RepID=Q0EXB6_9PROT|nr:sensory box histidine kinase/response regulator [Mariprofundus ferrooxydans PV-1]KON48291.1 histidine kinase [Mariprofundus ferrooxydans]
MEKKGHPEGGNGMNISEQFPLLDHIPTGILAINRYGEIVLWNRMLEQWTDSKREQMIGQNLFECFPELNAPQLRIQIDQVLADGASVTFSPQLHHHVIPCRLPDGSWRSQLVTISWLATHEVALFSIQDLSDQHRLIEKYRFATAELEDELRRSQTLEREKSQLAAAIDQAGEAVIITDTTGQIQYTNRAFLKQTGWNHKEIHTIDTIYDTFFAKTDTEFTQELQALLQSGKTWQGRQQIIRKDGSRFTASVSIAPIFNDEHSLTHHIIIQEDISRQITLEEKFRHTQKQEALITLIGGIAHDFNNLLAGLVGQAYLAAREVSDMPKTAARIKNIQGITQEAAEIVNQLLTFARQGEMHSKEFPLSSFIKEFAKLAARSVPKNIRLTTDFDSGRFAFRGDPNQLQQALLNIVQNAVDSLQERSDGQIKIGLFSLKPAQDAAHIQKFPVLRHGNFCHICIHDNGSGIPAEIQERIFDPFFSTKKLGSGLGLAMVMGCIRHHQGIIDVDSSPTGTTVHLFVPTIKHRGVLTPREPAEMHHSGVSILLADDDERVLEPTMELLEAMGHQVTLARNGVEAYEVFVQHPESWDIVITDMVMPRMNGLEASQKMRLLRPDIPLIYATGYDQSLVIDNTQKVDNSTLISKPFNPDDLDSLIMQMVKRNRKA